MTRRNPYAPHLNYVVPAMARTEIWRVFLVAVGFELAFFVTPLIVRTLLPNAAAMRAYQEGVTALATLAQFFAFGIIGALLLTLIGLLHNRGLASLLGPRTAMRRNLIRVAIAVAIVLAVQEPVILWFDRDLIIEMRSFSVWLIWLVPALVALLVQVGTEEIFFRGYLQQQLAARSSSRWIWMGIPSLMFGIGHLANSPDATEATLWAVWSFMLGLACADLTARTGNLGAAIGLHLSNNAFALLIVAVKGWPLSGLALFLYPYQDPMSGPILALSDTPALILQIMISALGVFVMWMAARLTLRV